MSERWCDARHKGTGERVYIHRSDGGFTYLPSADGEAAADICLSPLSWWMGTLMTWCWIVQCRVDCHTWKQNPWPSLCKSAWCVQRRCTAFPRQIWSLLCQNVSRIRCRCSASLFTRTVRSWVLKLGNWGVLCGAALTVQLGCTLSASWAGHQKEDPAYRWQHHILRGHSRAPADCSLFPSQRAVCQVISALISLLPKLENSLKVMQRTLWATQIFFLTLF